MKKIFSLLMITISASLWSQITTTEMPIDTSDDSVPPVSLVPEEVELFPLKLSERTIEALKKFDASEYSKSYSKKGYSSLTQIAHADILKIKILGMVKSVEENYIGNTVYSNLVTKLEEGNTDLTKIEIQLLLDISRQQNASGKQSYRPEVVDVDKNLKEVVPKSTGSNNSGSTSSNE